MKLKPKQKVTLPIALDSGAHSLYNKFFAFRDEGGTRSSGIDMIQRQDFGYMKDPRFRRYVDDYMEALTTILPHTSFCVTLDIIYNAPATWDLYKEFRANGFDVLPVYHFGEDIKWLKRYMNETDYIGIGGLGQYNTKQNWLPFGIATWKAISDKKGRPLVKTHGFAMSSFDLMSRWPWYSVDSTSAFLFSRMGAVMLPNATSKKGVFNFTTTPTIFPVADGRRTDGKHIRHRHPTGAIARTFNQYLEGINLSLPFVTESYVARDTANLYFMNRCMEELSKRQSERLGRNLTSTYYASGNPTENVNTFHKILARLKALDSLDHLSYLGTFFPGNRRTVGYLFDKWHGVQLA